MQETISVRETVTMNEEGGGGGGGLLASDAASGSGGGAGGVHVLGNGGLLRSSVGGGDGETITIRETVTNEGFADQRQGLARGRASGISSSHGGLGLRLGGPGGAHLNEHRVGRSGLNASETTTFKEVVHTDGHGRHLHSGASSAAALDTQAIIREAAAQASQGFAEAAHENVQVHVTETHRLQPAQPETVTHRETIRLRPQEPPREQVYITESVRLKPNPQGIENIQTELQNVKALRTELELVKAGLEQPSQTGIDTIRQELETVKADLERPKRGRSVPVTPRVYYRPVCYQPMSPMVPIQPAVWAPPPLPPVSTELTARLDALEVQRVDKARELRVEQLRQELLSSQASAAQRRALEVQLENSSAEWRERVEVLETKHRQDQATLNLRAEEEMRAREEADRLRIELQASRDAEARQREENDRLRVDVQELDRLRVELQVARDADKNNFDLQLRRLQEDNERLRIEIQTIRDTELRTRGELQRDAADVDRLQQELQRQGEEARRNADKVQMSERRIVELSSEMDGLRQGERRGSLTLQDIRRQLQVVIGERDVALSDVGHLKKANAQREAEARNLRQSLQEEQNAINLMKKENETLRAELQMVNARLRLVEDETRNRQIQDTITTKVYETRSSSPVINVDLTDNRDSMVRKEVVEETITVDGGERSSTTRVARFSNEDQGGSHLSRSSAGGRISRSSNKRRSSGDTANAQRVTKTVVEIEESSSSSSSGDERKR